MKDQNDQDGKAGAVFPMRINKYLAMEGRGSRREMDKLVEAGKVQINGKTAVLGDKVAEGDRVEIKFRGTREKQVGNEFAAKRRNQKHRKG